MPDPRAKPAAPGRKPLKPSPVWGRRTAEFYEDLKNQQVIVAVSDGQRFAGKLVGVDTYEIHLRQDSGLELLIVKGNVVYVHRRN